MLNLQSKDLKQQRVNELKTIFPEIFEDNTINYDKLKDILEEEIAESGSEHYSFNWSGKKDCFKIIKAKTNAKIDETLKTDKYSFTKLSEDERNFYFCSNLDLETL